MARYDLSESEWNMIEDIFPVNSDRRGRPWKEHRSMLNGIFWILRSGAPWRDLPERYGKWKTVYDRFMRYHRNGTLDKILDRLTLKLDEEGKIDWDLCSIDGTNIRANRSATAPVKKSAPVNQMIML